MKTSFQNVVADDLVSYASSVRTAALEGSIALDTFIPSEAYDWSGDIFPICSLPAAHGMWLFSMVVVRVCSTVLFTLFLGR